MFCKRFLKRLFYYKEHDVVNSISQKRKLDPPTGFTIQQTMRTNEVFIVEKIENYSDTVIIRTTVGTFFTRKNAKFFAEQLMKEHSSNSMRYIYGLSKPSSVSIMG